MDYRLHLLDDDGRVGFRIRIGCDGDDHALDISRGAADGRAMQLWCGDRLVKAFAADRDIWESSAPPPGWSRARRPEARSRRSQRPLSGDQHRFD